MPAAEESINKITAADKKMAEQFSRSTALITDGFNKQRTSADATTGSIDKLSGEFKNMTTNMKFNEGRVSAENFGKTIEGTWQKVSEKSKTLVGQLRAIKNEISQME